MVGAVPATFCWPGVSGFLDAPSSPEAQHPPRPLSAVPVPGPQALLLTKSRVAGADTAVCTHQKRASVSPSVLQAALSVASITLTANLLWIEEGHKSRCLSRSYRVRGPRETRLLVEVLQNCVLPTTPFLPAVPAEGPAGKWTEAGASVQGTSRTSA